MTPTIPTARELLARLAAHPEGAGVIRYGRRPLPPDEPAGAATTGRLGELFQKTLDELLGDPPPD